MGKCCICGKQADKRNFIDIKSGYFCSSECQYRYVESVEKEEEIDKYFNDTSHWSEFVGYDI